MKKIAFVLFAVLSCVSVAKADNAVTVADINAPVGGQAILEMNLNNDTPLLPSMMFKIVLPEGITIEGSPEAGNRVTSTGLGYEKNLLESTGGSNIYKIVGYAMSTDPIPGNSGVIMVAKLNIPNTLQVGTELEGQLTELGFTTTEYTSLNLPDVTFKITIVKNAVELDENSTTTPTAAEGVDVHVKRTIKANEWSTICLPFAMNESQVKSAFGSDVQLANFTGYETEKNEEGKIVGIKVNFNKNLKAIGANHPCLIRVSSNVSEFTVEGVDINPEEDPTVATVTRTRRQWSELIGTYVAETVLEESTLFLSDNQFWYSNPDGKTKMKAFRAYFDFYDVLDSVEDAHAKIGFFFDDASGIHDVTTHKKDDTDSIYTLNGVKVNGNADTLKKGVYIINGKKVLK